MNLTNTPYRIAFEVDRTQNKAFQVGVHYVSGDGETWRACDVHVFDDDSPELRRLKVEEALRMIVEDMARTAGVFEKVGAA